MVNRHSLERSGSRVRDGSEVLAGAYLEPSKAKQQAAHHSREGSEQAQLWPSEGHGQEEFDHKCSCLQGKPNILGEMLLNTHSSYS